jgi:hypothetical protein
MPHIKSQDPVYLVYRCSAVLSLTVVLSARSPAVRYHVLLWLLQEFHSMAQRCSAPATLHFLHSMNWIRDVNGASHVDLVARRFAALEAGDAMHAAHGGEVGYM